MYAIGQPRHRKILSNPVMGVEGPGRKLGAFVHPFAAIHANVISCVKTAHHQMHQKAGALKGEREAGLHGCGVENMVHGRNAALMDHAPCAMPGDIAEGKRMHVFPMVGMKRFRKRNGDGLCALNFPLQQMAYGLGIQAAAGMFGMQTVWQPLLPAQKALHDQIKRISDMKTLES